jgi:voltage-gated potassium channel
MFLSTKIIDKHMDKVQLKEERIELLSQIDDLLDFPLILLSIVWLILIIFNFVYGLSPFMQKISFFIWGIFIIDFFVELAIAPTKKDYMMKNWIVLFSLFLPAIGVLRLFSGLRVIHLANFFQSFTLTRIISSLNKSIKTIRQIIKQKGLEYVLLLTTLVVFLGAAGMYNFERGGLNSYWDAVWWTAMIMTTIGSDYWPKTADGRILAFILSVYAFSIFGYITAALASLLIGRDEKAVSNEISELHGEIQNLSTEIKRLSEKENKLED